MFLILFRERHNFVVFILNSEYHCSCCLRVCTDLLTQAQHHVTRARKIDEQERQLREKQEQERELLRQRQQLEAEQKAKEKEQQLQQLEEQRQQFKLKTQNLLQFKEEPEQKKKSKVNKWSTPKQLYYTMK